MKRLNELKRVKQLHVEQRREKIKVETESETGLKNVSRCAGCMSVTKFSGSFQHYTLCSDCNSK